MKVKATKFYSEDGRLLFEDPVVLRRYYSVGQDLVEDRQRYIVTAVRVEDCVQMVTVKPCPP